MNHLLEQTKVHLHVIEIMFGFPPIVMLGSYLAVHDVTFTPRLRVSIGYLAA